MIKKQYLNACKKYMLSYAAKRRDVIKMSGDALHLAKRAIFAMHRDNIKEAEEKLKQSESIFKSFEKRYKNDPEIKNEGSYKAAVEEYVEANILYQFLTTEKIGEISDIDRSASGGKTLGIEPSSYIAGLCDVPGELLRYATKAATEKDLKTVEKCVNMGQEIVGELIEFNLTSYLRTKFDQAKRAVQKLEYVLYELSLRKE